MNQTAATAQQSHSTITSEVISAHGLSDDEYARILKIMGREPNLVELGIFSVMWSEHCSYKTTRKWLSKLPTKGPQVICGPGENAGVIDIGDGQAAIFKIESHNHPSFIEPFQGAATGVGGILRDVFTMGARPIALMNSLRFGDPAHPKTRHLLGGVVSGISHYGNCVGVPTVGGECIFDKAYNGNILVNAMAVGLADADKIFYSKAEGVGNPIIYFGSKTGRDGIHGATMASAEFDETIEEKRPTVQVGDPFTEKLLIEACLELMATDAIVAIQDMGAAGLTCSSLEMAGKGGLGVELNLNTVPIREDGMTPYEIMLSESQERMLMVIKPDHWAEVEAILQKWELPYGNIGTLTDTGNLVLKMDDQIVCDMPVAPVSLEAPIYDRPFEVTPLRETLTPESVPAPNDLGLALEQLIASPDLCSKRWIWEQYDHMVMNDTVMRPGGDAAVVRVHGTNKGLAITTDCTPRYCFADPVEGGKQAVAEAYRNLSSVGATPLATTNCLNFGNPEKPEIMGQLVGCLEGMGKACHALDMPIVSGNVSMYNETHGQAILPTPTIGAVGLLNDVHRAKKNHVTEEDLTLFIVGDTHGHLGSSLYVRDVLEQDAGAPPPVDFTLEKRHSTFVRKMIEMGYVHACHDVSDGGLLTAITDMCMPKRIGAELQFPDHIPPHAFAFGEDQARYVLAVADHNKDEVFIHANEVSVPLLNVGKTGGDFLIIEDITRIPIEHLAERHAMWMPGYMSS